MGSKGLRVRLIKWLTYVCSVAYSCQTLRSPIDCSPPGSSVHGNFQARILEQVAISFSRRPSWPRDWTHVSCISCTGRQGLYQLSHQGSPLFIFYLGWFSHKATITITLFWTRYLEMEVKIKIHAEKWNIQTDNGQTIHDNRPMNWPYMQLAQNRHNLINDCQLPSFITLLLTQDQPEKSQICSLIYHIGYPASSQPVASNANNLQSEHTWSLDRKSVV